MNEDFNSQSVVTGETWGLSLIPYEILSFLVLESKCHEKELDSSCKTQTYACVKRCTFSFSKIEMIQLETSIKNQRLEACYS